MNGSSQLSKCDMVKASPASTHVSRGVQVGQFGSFLMKNVHSVTLGNRRSCVIVCPYVYLSRNKVYLHTDLQT